MTHVDWNPYPEEKPPKPKQIGGEFYLITLSPKINPPDPIGIGLWLGDTDPLQNWKGLPDNYVIAWAEEPEPYKPQEPLDMHPDAITARKYAEGDPETVKALHIFDE